MKNFLRRMPSSRPTLIWYRVFAFIIPQSGLFFILCINSGQKRLKLIRKISQNMMRENIKGQSKLMNSKCLLTFNFPFQIWTLKSIGALLLWLKVNSKSRKTIVQKDVKWLSIGPLSMNNVPEYLNRWTVNTTQGDRLSNFTFTHAHTILLLYILFVLPRAALFWRRVKVQ